MRDIFNELSQLLEKTNVIIKFDRTKVGYTGYGQSEVESGIEPNEADKYYYYIVSVDGYSSLIKYCTRLDFLIQNVSEEIDIQIDNKFYYKDIKQWLLNCKSIIDSIYSISDINTFYDQADQRLIGSNTEYNFEPNVYITYEDGTEFDSDFGEFKEIGKFLEKKVYCVNRIRGLVNTSLEILKESGGNTKLGTIRFSDEDLINSPRFIKFRTKLNDSDLIDKINARHFDKCFTGKEVEKKINWKSDNLSCVYFVRKLNPYLLRSNRIDWNAISNTFLFKSETIIPKSINTTTAPCSQEKRGMIDEIIKQLDQKTAASPAK